MSRPSNTRPPTKSIVHQLEVLAPHYIWNDRPLIEGTHQTHIELGLRIEQNVRAAGTTALVGKKHASNTNHGVVDTEPLVVHIAI